MNNSQKSSRDVVENMKNLSTNPLEKIVGNKVLSEILNNNVEHKKLIIYGDVKRKSLNTIISYKEWRKIKYKIYDDCGMFLYAFRGEETFFKKRFSFSVYDPHGKRAGGIRETFISLRTPLIAENNPHNYELICNGKKITTIKTTKTIKGLTIRKYVDTNYGFSIECNKITRHTNVYDKQGHVVMEVHNVNALTLKSIFVIELYQSIEDILAVLIYAAVMSDMLSTQ